jgi:hypothetical protein
MTNSEVASATHRFLPILDWAPDKPFIYPPDVKDLFAWTSGYIEGRRDGREGPRT